MKRLCLVLSWVVATGAPAIAAAADAARGKTLYAGCVACHGESGAGNEALQAPALAGLDAVYLMRQLHNFKAGIRGADVTDTAGAQMRASAALLADEAAMTDVTAYIASFPPPAVAPVCATVRITTRPRAVPATAGAPRATPPCSRRASPASTRHTSSASTSISARGCAARTRMTSTAGR